MLGDVINLPNEGDILVDNKGVSWAIVSVQYKGNTKNCEEQVQKNWSCELDEVPGTPSKTGKTSWKGRSTPSPKKRKRVSTQ